jgi:hypothetical protein
MIPPSGTFEYEAEFTSDSFRESDIMLQGTSTYSMDMDRLVGHQPMIRFWHDRLVLVASEQANSKLRNASFPIGDVVMLAARAGDRLYVVRTGRGGIGLSLLREQRLVLAIGAVTAVPLGMNIKVIQMPKDHHGWGARGDEWLDFEIESKQLTLRMRGVSRAADYEIYVEHCWEVGIPGVEECVSICSGANSAINIASLRSAVLLGHSPLKLTRWDGTEVFAQA